MKSFIDGVLAHSVIYNAKLIFTHKVTRVCVLLVISI